MDPACRIRGRGISSTSRLVGCRMHRMGMRVSPHHTLTVLGFVKRCGGSREVRKRRSSRWRIMIIIGRIRDRDRKGHGGCERPEMTGKGGKWTIVVVVESGREVGGSGSYRSKMVGRLRSWSHLSRRVGGRMMECLLRHWSRLLEGGGNLERCHCHEHPTRQLPPHHMFQRWTDLQMIKVVGMKGICVIRR
jgi:hypothetical protein